MASTEQIYSLARDFVLSELEKQNYPDNHPFSRYPSDPESKVLEMIILIRAFTNEDSLVKSFLKKCKSVENGVFSFQKYNQNISEIIWFYYLCIGLLETNFLSLETIFDENLEVYDNNKKFEFSFLLSIAQTHLKLLINSEVKTLLCDPFQKENGLRYVDGQKLIKPLFPDLRDSEELKQDSSAIVLHSSTYYYQVSQNIKKIINKCRGKNISGHPLFNVGILVVNASTSFEEFYAYLFHEHKGVYKRLLSSNVDALVLLSLDAHNDMKLENLYSMGYIQTALINPSETNKRICEQLRLDNYIALGTKIFPEVYKAGQSEYGYYKILCRDGFLNIIPYDSTEDQIEEYLDYLKSPNVRY